MYPVSNQSLPSHWTVLSFLLSQKTFFANAIAYALVLRQTLEKEENKKKSTLCSQPIIQSDSAIALDMADEGKTNRLLYVPAPHPDAMHNSFRVVPSQCPVELEMFRSSIKKPIPW